MGLGGEVHEQVGAAVEHLRDAARVTDVAALDREPRVVGDGARFSIRPA